jgi:NAD(P)H-hydrate epimerase
MRALEARLIRRLAVPPLLLMENAGRSAAERIKRMLGRRGGQGAVIFCGTGNNGGDGFVVARHLAREKIPVRVVLARAGSRIQGDARTNLKILGRLGVPIDTYAPGKRGKILQACRKAAVVVDALLGTGTSGPLREPYARIVELINRSGRPVAALDIPTGLDADTGTAPGAAVKAALTVTMGLPKKGLLEQAARRWVGRLEVADLGVPIPFHSQGG